MSVVMRLAYDGSDLHGFARQPGQRTVQGELERALARIYKAPVLVRGASRTDAGVHARGQLVAFDPPFEIAIDGIARAVGAGLPRDVVVTSAWLESSPDGGPVQPRHANLGKHYRYQIRCGPLPDPFQDRYVWQRRGPLDLAAMRDAATGLVGIHDFGSFRAGDCQSATTTREIYGVDLEAQRGRTHDRGHDPEAFPRQRDAVDIRIDVRGSAFLKHMVRILVGTLVEVGAGRRRAETIAGLLEKIDRRFAGPTAPARGLCLEEVIWPGPRGPRGA